jgi:hypothetical protein
VIVRVITRSTAASSSFEVLWGGIARDERRLITLAKLWKRTRSSDQKNSGLYLTGKAKKEYSSAKNVD